MGLECTQLEDRCTPSTCPIPHPEMLPEIDLPQQAHQSVLNSCIVRDVPVNNGNGNH